MRRDKSWGRINARPSEYMIHLRRGRIVAQGHGLSIFAWPGDSWVLVPTSIHRVAFTADQVTAEKVGVEVRGIAVYRVADPLLAFQVLAFEEGAPMERTAEILQDMFIGAARRLVANMTVEACMTRRKEEIAVELMREIAPVVSGEGRPDDRTDRGWGLVIDTIEIQDVRILSETVFENLQAPYRASIEMSARQSQVERDREVHLREVESKHARLEADQRLTSRRHEVEEASRLSAIDRDQRIRVAEVDAATEIDELEHRLAVDRADRRGELKRRDLTEEVELLEAELEIARRRGELEADLQRMVQEVENLVSAERIEYEYVREVLPVLARTMVESLGDVDVTQVISGDDGLGHVAGLLAQLGGLREALWRAEDAVGRAGEKPGGLSIDRVTRGQPPG